VPQGLLLHAAAVAAAAAAAAGLPPRPQGGSCANFICNVGRRRSNGARTVDWELILMMEPTTIAGALFGAILNKVATAM
jgi:uncharacterized membrane protein YfcA